MSGQTNYFTSGAVLTPYRDLVQEVDTVQRVGRVTELIGLVAAVRGLQCELGELCMIELQEDVQQVLAEVVGFRRAETLVMPLGDLHGIGPGTKVHPTGHSFRLRVGPHLLGKVVDGLGYPMGEHLMPDVPKGSRWYDTNASPPDPLNRQRIDERLPMAVRVLDSIIPCGKGQRLGIFAGSGVGKSSLLGMIARGSESDVNVICLVGERGREVQDFIERDLGPEGLARSVVVAATSDQPALVRIKAALVATTIAEFFRDRGQHVLLMMDSVTRLAMAQRDLGLAVGEPPATRGYTPSVFAMLPRILERAGATKTGSITALYTVLVEGDDMNEPIADAVRGILDGHIVLDRNLAQKNHYPAIDVLQSVSRLSTEILRPEVLEAAGRLRETLARYQDREDAIVLGVYEGGDPMLDYAIGKMPQINQFLQQVVSQLSDVETADQQLIEMMSDYPDVSTVANPIQHEIEEHEDFTPVIPTLNLNP